MRVQWHFFIAYVLNNPFKHMALKEKVNVAFSQFEVYRVLTTGITISLSNSLLGGTVDRSGSLCYHGVKAKVTKSPT